MTVGRKGILGLLRDSVGRSVILTCQEGFDFRGTVVSAGRDGVVLRDASFQMAAVRHEGMKQLDGLVGVPAGTVHFVQVV